ncbi:MAG TPA: GGDEF domain-containing protein [Nitrospirae bacterium]|nr:GGDEF domain-containing protein [Nitrospirota bacterium]
MNTSEDKSTDKISCEALSEPIVVFDKDGYIQTHNLSFQNMVGECCKGRNIRSIPGLSDVWSLFTWYLKKRLDNQRRNRFSYKNREYDITFNEFYNDNRNLYSIVFHDISHFVSIEQELLKRNKELIAINNLSTVFMAARDMDVVFNRLMETVMMITDFSLGWLVLFEEGGERIVSMKGVSESLEKSIREGCISKLMEAVFNESDPLFIFDHNDIQLIPCLKKEGINFFGIIPLRGYDTIKGFICLGNRLGRSFDFDTASMMSLIGNQVSLIIEKVKLFEETKRLSITDALTGLYNARFFYQSLDKEIQRAKRYDESFSLIIFDIDDFKDVNDTYGHQAGDEILIEFSQILLRHTRKTDIVSRYGGEEFVIILPNTRKEVACSLAERIMNEVSHTAFKANDCEIRITVSGGIAGFPDDGATAKDLLYCADMALYEAKSRGKKRIIQYRGTENEDCF